MVGDGIAYAVRKQKNKAVNERGIFVYLDKI
jgi:hypothetical protein